jgi:hypothetical protein
VAAPAREVRWGGAKFIGTASYGLWAQDEAELLKTGGTVWGVARRYAVSGRVLS